MAVSLREFLLLHHRYELCSGETSEPESDVFSIFGEIEKLVERLAVPAASNCLVSHLLTLVPDRGYTDYPSRVGLELAGSDPDNGRRLKLYEGGMQGCFLGAKFGIPEIGVGAILVPDSPEMNP